MIINKELEQYNLENRIYFQLQIKKNEKNYENLNCVIQESSTSNEHKQIGIYDLKSFAYKRTNCRHSFVSKLQPVPTRNMCAFGAIHGTNQARFYSSFSLLNFILYLSLIYSFLASLLTLESGTSLRKFTKNFRKFTGANKPYLFLSAALFSVRHRCDDGASYLVAALY